MDLRAAPAALPALGVLAGAALGLRLVWLPVPLVLALVAAALALGGGGGRAVTGLAAGLLAAAVGPAPPRVPWPGVDPGRPVAVTGRIVEPWRRLEWGWRGELRVERLRQGFEVRAEPRRLAIELAGEEPPPALGSGIRARGYLGRPSCYANRIPVPPGPWRLRVKTRRLLEVTAPPAAVPRAAAWLRSRVERAMRAATLRAPRSWAPEARPAARPTAASASNSRFREAPPQPGRMAAGAGGVAAGPAPGPRATHATGHGPALARALVLGEPDDLPPRWRRGLRRAGLAHLLAVSGLHAGLVAGVAWLLAAPLPRAGRIAAALAATAGYLALVGPRPSIVRASAMVAIAGVSLLARRGPAAGNALAVAAAGLALSRPGLVAEVGFQLTVAATAGIVFLAPRLERRWSGGGEGGARERRPAPARDRPAAARRWLVWRWMVRGLAATVAAQLASLPFALPVFHLTSWTAPPFNLVAVPYTAFALAACLGWTALAMVSPAAAGGLLPLLDRLAMPFGWPAAGPPSAWGTVAAAAPPVACWLLAGSAAAWLLRPRRRRWLLAVVALAGWWTVTGALPRLPAASFTASAAGAAPGAAGAEPPVSITLIDVGQGDAVLLRDGGRALLVDGGGWRHGDFGGRVLLPALLGEGVRRLDAAALTHPDADHCHGLAQIASYLPVGEVWLPPQWRDDDCAAELQSAAGGSTALLAAGGRRRLGRWRVSVLHPPWAMPAAAGSGPGAARSRAAPGGVNRLSLVLRAEALGRCVLLTGDLDRAGERRIASHGVDLGCGLLKVGHHGSKTSTGPTLLRAAGPRLALISAGRGNPYGHPAADVLARLERARVTVLRTDRLGLVRVEWSAGGPVRIATPAAPP